MYEFQKIITSIFLVILVVFGIAKLSNFIFKTDENVVAYKVEVQEKTSEVAVTEKIDLATFVALGNVEHGKKVFKKCAACHSINQAGGNKIGPKLWNVMFRPVGAVSDYKYSKTLLNIDKKWNIVNLYYFLEKPKVDS